MFTALSSYFYCSFVHVYLAEHLLAEYLHFFSLSRMQTKRKTDDKRANVWVCLCKNANVGESIVSLCMSARYLIQIEIYLFCHWINKLSENNCLGAVSRYSTTLTDWVCMCFVCICAGHIFLSWIISFGHLQTSLPFGSLWHGTNAIRFCTMSFRWHFLFIVCVCEKESTTNTILLPSNNK